MARWNDAKARKLHANECNVSTRGEEFVLSFGVGRTPETDDELVIELLQHLVMTPHVAKRLAVMLDGVLREHETRYGSGPASGQKGSSRGPV